MVAPDADREGEAQDTTTQKTITVITGSFGGLIASGLRAELGADPRFELVAHGVEDFDLDAALTEHKPRVAILDYCASSSSTRIRHLRFLHTRTAVLLLASAATAAEFDDPQELDADACLAYDAPIRDILGAVALVARGLRMLPDERRVAASVRGSGFESLTPREREVLDLLRAGQSNAQIGLALHIGVETAKTHVKSILRKLGATSRRDFMEPRRNG